MTLLEPAQYMNWPIRSSNMPGALVANAEVISRLPYTFG